MGFALGVFPFFFFANRVDDDIVLGGRMVSGADGVKVHDGERRLIAISIDKAIAALEASLGGEVAVMVRKCGADS